jgi:quercetin dioxygenase-like cupin family protein
MRVVKSLDVEDVTIEKFPYRGKMFDVKGISVRWLSTVGEEGSADYGLRLFTAKPGGEIPIHNHFYHQTMYIVSGEFECWQFDAETDELASKVICGPGDSVYVPSMEPHGMKNTSDSEPATFLCCICNVFDD